MITFAVIGHNEESTLERALNQAVKAVRAGDVVWFVDSASTDKSRAVAERAGIKHLLAPIGKGRAMRYAMDKSDSKFICFIDSDLVSSSQNIPLALAEAIRANPSNDMIIGEFEDTGLLSNTIGIYEPLVAKLFPEAYKRYGEKPLSGFRIIRLGQDLGQIPDDFGVEAHLNVTLALNGAKTSVCPIGSYEGRFLYKPHMGEEISKALLDLAVSNGRLDKVCRPAWEDWVNDVIKHIASYHGDSPVSINFENGLRNLASRPLPSASPW